MYRPEVGQWYDIATEEKLKNTYVEFMFYNVFDEYNVHLDFIADNLVDKGFI